MYKLLGWGALTMHPRLRRRHKDSVPPVDESTSVSGNRELVGKLLETVGLRLLNVTTVHQPFLYAPPSAAPPAAEERAERADLTDLTALASQFHQKTTSVAATAFKCGRAHSARTSIIKTRGSTGCARVAKWRRPLRR